MNKLSPVVLWTLWTALPAYILPFNISHFNMHSESIWFKIWRKTLGQFIQSQIKQSKLCIFCFSLLKILEVEKEKEKISRSRRGEKSILLIIRWQHINSRHIATMIGHIIYFCAFGQENGDNVWWIRLFILSGRHRKKNEEMILEKEDIWSVSER